MEGFVISKGLFVYCYIPLLVGRTRERLKYIIFWHAEATACQRASGTSDCLKICERRSQLVSSGRQPLELTSLSPTSGVGRQPGSRSRVITTTKCLFVLSASLSARECWSLRGTESRLWVRKGRRRGPQHTPTHRLSRVSTCSCWEINTRSAARVTACLFSWRRWAWLREIKIGLKARDKNRVYLKSKYGN